MHVKRGGQASEKQRTLTCDGMGKTVARRSAGWTNEGASLYGANSGRKYLNQSERSRTLAAINQLDPRHALFALVLAWTGARISEVLALTPGSFQIESGVVTIVTLKRRKHSVREVPIPPELMRSLDRRFSLRRRQQDGAEPRRLWEFCRMTAWRIIKRVMRLAQVSGPQASPRGLRHSFGVLSLQSGVPLTLVQRWMGHARLSTTAIYLDVSGPEELAFASKFWRAA